MVDWNAVIAATNTAFGEPFTVAAAMGAPLIGPGGLPVIVIGVFIDAYAQRVVLEDGSLEWTTTSPVLGVQLSQFPLPPLQDSCLIRQADGTVYRITDKKIDSVGGAHLILGRAV